MDSSKIGRLWTCFTFILIFMKTTSGIMDVSECFGSEFPSITWAHRVNSKSQLELALNDSSINMIEADILLGSIDGSSELIPIMAHPPDNTSDLSFQTFLDAIVDLNYKYHLRKGMKLDFKVIDVVEPVLRILEDYNLKENALDFPVWLNADILPGPVNATRKPVDGDKFLNLTKTYLPDATLSLGWTTRYGRDDFRNPIGTNPPRTIKKGSYSEENVNNMINLINKWKITVHITFPIRAGLAVSSSSIDRLLNLQSIMDSSFTLWAAEDDPVDIKLLNNTILKIGSGLFIDLPFDLSTGPTTIPDQVPVSNSKVEDISQKYVLSSGESYKLSQVLSLLLNILVIKLLLTKL